MVSAIRRCWAPSCKVPLDAPALLVGGRHDSASRGLERPQRGAQLGLEALVLERHPARSPAPPPSSPVRPRAQGHGSAPPRACRWPRISVAARLLGGLRERHRAPPVIHPLGRIARRPVDDLERRIVDGLARSHPASCCALGRTQSSTQLARARLAARARERTSPIRNATETAGVPRNATAPSTLGELPSSGLRRAPARNAADGRSHSHARPQPSTGHELQPHQAGAAHQAADKPYRHTGEDGHAELPVVQRQEHGVDEARLGARQHERIGRAVGSAAGPGVRRAGNRRERRAAGTARRSALRP